MFRVTFPDKTFQSKALKQIHYVCERAVKHQGSITAIIGDVGIGKTVAVYEAIATQEEKGVQAIWIKQPDKESLSIGQVMATMIKFLGEEPKWHHEVKAEQLRRLLGTKSQQSEIVMVIDEAHALHRNTLRALKRLLELGFGRRMGLFSVILVAQPEMYSKLRMVPEINLRTRKVEMQDFSKAEAKLFVEWVVEWEGAKITDDAKELIADKIRNPLRIASAVTSLTEVCESVGEDKITKELCQRIWTKDTRATMEEYGITHEELARTLNWSRTKVTMALNGTYPVKVDEEKLNGALSTLVALKVR